MNPTTATAATATATATDIAVLRTFALAHNEIAFAHLCTAALHQLDATLDSARAYAVKATGHCIGCDCTECSLLREESVIADDAWAVERLTTGSATYPHTPVLRYPGYSYSVYQGDLRIIRATDTTRPDGAIARNIQI